MEGEGENSARGSNGDDGREMRLGEGGRVGRITRTRAMHDEGNQESWRELQETGKTDKD